MPSPERSLKGAPKVPSNRVPYDKVRNLYSGMFPAEISPLGAYKNALMPVKFRRPIGNIPNGCDFAQLECYWLN